MEGKDEMNGKEEGVGSGTGLLHQDGALMLLDGGGDHLIEVREVAKILSCSERTVWRWRDNGHLPAPVTIGRVVRWSYRTIMSWIEAGCPCCEAERSA